MTAIDWNDRLDVRWKIAVVYTILYIMWDIRNWIWHFTKRGKPILGSYDIKLDNMACIVHPMNEMSAGRDGVEEYINDARATMWIGQVSQSAWVGLRWNITPGKQFYKSVVAKRSRLNHIFYILLVVTKSMNLYYVWTNS